MGRLRDEYVRRRWIELTAEDCRLQRERQRWRSDIEPKMFEWHRTFTEKLDRCPYCGGIPRLGCTWSEHDGYDYKYSCGNRLEKGQSTLPNRGWCNMECGDWYNSLARAGLSWNYRCREARGEPHKFVRHEPYTRVPRRART